MAVTVSSSSSTTVICVPWVSTLGVTRAGITLALQYFLRKAEGQGLGSSLGMGSAEECVQGRAGVDSSLPGPLVYIYMLTLVATLVALR